MASEAEVELVISTANALPQLQRELDDLVHITEAQADSIDLEATLSRRDTVADLLSELDGILAATEAGTGPIPLHAQLETVETLQDVLNELDNVIDIAEAHAQAIELDAQLDADMAALDAELAALVAELEAGAPEVDIEVDVDREGRGRGAIQGLTRLLGPLGSGVGAVVPKMASLGAAAGAAGPLLAGVVGALQNIAPAAALAVPSLIALQLATNTVKIAMIGVGDAVKTAFDPEAKPEELAKALENLAPHARDFVTELRGMRSWLSLIQKDIQNRFFEDFDRSLEELSVTVLPDLADSLKRTSSLFNLMARDVASTAAQLSRDGTLGTALQGAETGLSNLSLIPGQVTKALGQLGAAAAPAFTRLTAAAGQAAAGISERLSKAFDNGGLEKAIGRAVDSLAQLGRVVGNIFEGVGNIIEGFSQSGEGLFGTLEKVSRAFADFTGTSAFGQAMAALSKTISTLVTTALPLVTQAFSILGPVIETLAPPIQELIKALGPVLGRILDALRPVLQSIATAFGKLVVALTPLITLAGNLIAAILPILVPLFDSLGQIIAALTPFIQQLADNVASQLLPVFTVLAMQVLPAILPPLVEMAQKIIPLLTKVLVEIAPFVAAFTMALVKVIEAVLPLIVQILELQSAFLDDLLPVIAPVIEWLVKFVTGGLSFATNFINGVVVPALNFLAALLKGDFSQAWQIAKDAIKRAIDKVTQFIQDWVEGVVGDLQTLPQRAQDALAGIGTALYQKGRDLVQGLINGIQSQIASLAATAAKMADIVTGGLASKLDIHSPSRVMMAMGEDTMAGFTMGLKDGVPGLEKELQSIGSMVPSFTLPNGQQLALPQFQQQAPTVQVYLGNELLNSHVDTRIAAAGTARERLAFQGVRR